MIRLNARQVIADLSVRWGWTAEQWNEYDGLTEDLDTTTPNGEFVANLTAAYIQFKGRQAAGD